MDLRRIEQQADTLEVELTLRSVSLNQERLVASVNWAIATLQSLNEAYADFETGSLSTWGMLADGDRFWLVRAKLDGLRSLAEYHLRGFRTREDLDVLIAETKELVSPGDEDVPTAA